jgi:hypothetical protein
MQELENYWAVQTVQNRDTWLGTTAGKVFTVCVVLDVPQTLGIVTVCDTPMGVSQTVAP